MNLSLSPQKCRVCGCTDNDCRQCIEATGHPCYWVQPDLCSACDGQVKAVRVVCSFKDSAGMDQTLSFDVDITIGDEAAEIKEACIAALKAQNWKDYILGPASYAFI